MKNILLVLCCMATSSIFAMNNQIIPRITQRNISEDRRIASALDAYMAQKMIPATKKEFKFSDYESPQLFYHCSSKEINLISRSVKGIVHSLKKIFVV